MDEKEWERTAFHQTSTGQLNILSVFSLKPNSKKLKKTDLYLENQINVLQFTPSDIYITETSNFAISLIITFKSGIIFSDDGYVVFNLWSPLLEANVIISQTDDTEDLD